MWWLVVGCVSSGKPGGEPGDSGAGGGVDVEQVPAAHPDEAVYDDTVLHTVDIELSDEDWDTLRDEARSLVDMLDGECLAEPWAAPYTEFAAEVWFDGEALGTVGLRKKGLLGSASTERPSLRIDTDQYVEGQRYRGLERLVLNNNNQDESRMRTCLAHGFFADAGLVAPRCSLAVVRVNGEDLGLYANTESIDADLIERALGAPPTTLYEGRLSDFRDGWLGSFEAKTEASDGADLTAVAEALESDDDELLAALDAALDLDAFLTFWAAEGVAGHWDGYSGNTNNFYVYGQPDDGRLRFIAAGPDAAFDRREPFGDGEPVWVATAGALANRLIQHDEARELYEDRVQSLLDEAWDEEGRLAQIAAWDELIHDHTSRDERRAADNLAEIVAAKASDIEDQLGGRVDAGELRGDPCLVEVGEVTVDFSTTFGTYPDGDLYTSGSSTTYYEIQDTVYTSVLDGVSAGWYGDGRVLWLTISQLTDEVWIAPYAVFDPELVADGASLSIDGVEVEAALLLNSPDTGGSWQTAAYLGGGTLTLERAGTGDGDEWVGRLEVAVLGSEE